MRNPSAQTAPDDVTREVAPKAVPKKKVKKRVKGNVSVCEMRVLQGRDHLNVVGPISPPPFSPYVLAHACPRLSPNTFCCLPVGHE